MEDDGVHFQYSDDELHELWMIVTYCYGNRIEEDFKVLEGGSMEEPEQSFEIWDRFDMADCASEWCGRVVKQIMKKPFNDEDTCSLWNSFKTEFRLLACTEDKKYKDLRSQVRQLTGHKTQLACMSALASGIAVHMGIAVSTILTPLCAICCLAGARIGRELLCQRLALPDFEFIGVEMGDKKTPGRRFK